MDRYTHKNMEGLELLSDVCKLHEGLNKIQTYIDYEEVEFEAEETYSHYFRIHCRDHDGYFDDENEVLMYICSKCTHDENGYIHFQYEPMNVPKGGKCSLVFRTMEQVLAYLYKTSVLTKHYCT